MTGVAAIEAHGLSRVYSERLAVQSLSFAVKLGEIVGFLGPNGAGKSTTLRMLSGFLEPSAGTVKILGKDSVDDPIAARRQIGYMPENFPLYPELRVREYLVFRARIKDVPRKEIADRVTAALEAAHVRDVESRIIGQLSKGYRQRVGLADALLGDPPILVLDEPTSGLDPNQIREVRSLIKSFAGKKAVLLSTHILPEVEATTDRVLILDRGKLVRDAMTSALRDEAATRAVAVVRGTEETLERFRSALSERALPYEETKRESDAVLVTFTIPVLTPDATERVFECARDSGVVLRELTHDAGNLEDLFARLTKAEE